MHVLLPGNCINDIGHKLLMLLLLLSPHVVDVHVAAVLLLLQLLLPLLPRTAFCFMVCAGASAKFDEVLPAACNEIETVTITFVFILLPCFLHLALFNQMSMVAFCGLWQQQQLSTAVLVPGAIPLSCCSAS